MTAPRVWTPITERYDRSLEVALEEQWHPDDTPIAVGILARPTRVFAAGDVVFEHFSNGTGERWAFQGWSSKRRCSVTHHYLQYARHMPSAEDRAEAAECRRKNAHLRAEREKAMARFGLRHDWWWWWTAPSLQIDNRATVRLVMRSELLEGARPWSDPDLRRLALSALRAAYSARSVSTNSGPQPPRRSPA